MKWRLPAARACAGGEAAGELSFGAGCERTQIERLDHRPRSAAPGAPVRRIDDNVRVTGPVALETLAEVVSHPGKPFLRVREAASPIEKVQEVGQAGELEKFLARSRHGNPGLSRPLFQRRRLETAFEVHVHFGLGEAPQSDAQRRISKNLRQCRPPAHCFDPRKSGRFAGVGQGFSEAMLQCHLAMREDPAVPFGLPLHSRMPRYCRYLHNLNACIPVDFPYLAPSGPRHQRLRRRRSARADHMARGRSRLSGWRSESMREPVQTHLPQS
jgi:hypothetical protein